MKPGPWSSTAKVPKKEEKKKAKTRHYIPCEATLDPHKARAAQSSDVLKN
jgi:hypothetical protein